jgi:Cu/Ag efflux pump CusA
MIAQVIEYSVRNRFIVILITAVIAVWGVYCVLKTPIDAIPDLSENQVIVFTDWMGRAPQEIDDQITYPLSVNLQGLAGVKAIRSSSEFNFSMINIIFDDSVDFYFARQRVLERLNVASTYLPAGVVPYLAPDATALGQIFWYTVEGDGYSLDELRAIQDWYVRYQLYVAGVAEVASAGGFVREYQIDVDPAKLRAYEIPLGAISSAVSRSNIAVGGKVYLEANAEYLIRGMGWLRGVRDIEQIVVAERAGVPITVAQVATVQLGPEYRRSMLEKNGQEAVGGVVLMRYGGNPLTVTEAIKARIQQLQPGLPPGVRIVPFYERTQLIRGAIHTLTRTLTEELIVASIAILLILTHLRSAFVVCITLPLAVLVAFILMFYLKIPSNIMSLSGIAIAIGVLVDAAVVMVENATHELTREFGHERVHGDTTEIVVRACRLVGKPIFFAVLIMLISFLPVFALGGMEGKMFHPLAFTKSFAMVGVALLAITFVPAMIPLFIKGRLRREEDNWIVRSFINIYKPVLTWLMHVPAAGVWFMGFLFIIGAGFLGSRGLFLGILAVALFFGCMFFRRWSSQGLAFVLLGATALWAWHFPKLGREFMPPLDEGSILDMPVTVPRVSIAEASDDIRVRDAIMHGFPEVDQIVGKVGRADTATDPSGIDMVETIVTLRPKEWWPKRKMNYDDARAEAETLRAELLARGVLRSRDELLKDLQAAVADARAALTQLAADPNGLDPNDIKAPAALADAVAIWSKRSDQPNNPAAAHPEYGDALTRVAPLFRAALGAHSLPADAKLDRPAAYRLAVELLKGDLRGASVKLLDDEDNTLVESATTDAVFVFDRAMRELARRKEAEFEPVLAKQLVVATVNDLLALWREKGVLMLEPTAMQIDQLAEPLVGQHGLPLVQVPRLEEMPRLIAAIAGGLDKLGVVENKPELLLPPSTLWRTVADAALTAVGGDKPTVTTELFAKLEERRNAGWVERTRKLNWEIESEAFGRMLDALLEALQRHAAADHLLASGDHEQVVQALRDAREPLFRRRVFLWHAAKANLVKEMDAELQMPGWGNIWTQPIINRVDMLATGVRTMIGVKVYGPRMADETQTVTENGAARTVTQPGIQSVSNEIATVLRKIDGAVDVFPDQIVGRSYLQIDIDRAKAARYGVNVSDIQEAIEVAMGGKTITTTVEGRRRFPVRVRYARDYWQTEEVLRRTLVTGRRGAAEATPADTEMRSSAMNAGDASMPGGDFVQIPISEVTNIRVVEGPSVIKSENGMLRAYVQLNVRDRDIVGFVEEARAAVEAQVKLPQGFFIEWSGQFEAQVRARKTLQIIFPLVILLIFVLLYVTFRDVRDALLIILAVPGALVGGVIFQSLFGFNFSVAVWVGYIACFGMATQTGIVMLVYLHDAINSRGGLAKIVSLAELRDTIITGAVHRLRPKLMTEGVAIVGLMPMLWAHGVGAEVMKPMAAPVLGGLLVADEVIDLLLPVIFNWYQARRWRRLHGEAGGTSAGRAGPGGTGDAVSPVLAT